MKANHKKIAVLMGGCGGANGKAAEAMRMTVGLTLRNPGVHLLLVDGGTKLLQGKDLTAGPESSFIQHFNAYLDMGCPVAVEDTNGGDQKILLEGSGMEAWERQELIRFITESDLAILLDG
jgi:hypothetical protein